MTDERTRGDGARPTLYEGLSVPFDRLSAEDFEDFMFAVMQPLGQTLGFRPVGKPSGTGDGGFDIDAVREADGKRVCVQCKRYQRPLASGNVAVELAKVALTSALEGSDVAEHYVITTGKVQNNVSSLLREEGRTTLVKEACSAASSHADLKGLRERARAAGHSPDAVVTEYVQGLVTLAVWSGGEIDAQLSPVWSKIQDALERFFYVHPVLREHPRPDFEERAYLARHTKFAQGFVIPMGSPGTLPRNVRTQSAARPLPSTPAANQPDAPSAKRDPSLISILAMTSPGRCTLLTGPGGGGKTTALEMTLAAAATTRAENRDAPLPILVRLGQYDGSLSKLVQRALRISYGRWTSIPGSFLLLLDGLNELSPDLLQGAVSEIVDLVDGGRVACVVTLRDSGLRTPIVLPSVDRVFSVMHFGLQQVRESARLTLPPSSVSTFMVEFQRRLTMPSTRFLLLPFGVEAALQIFREEETFPETRAALLERIVHGRIERNRELARAIPQKLLEVPKSTLRALAEELSFGVRIVRGVATLPLDRAGEAVTNALKAAGARGLIGADGLNTQEVVQLLQHHELVVLSHDEILTFPHDLVAGYLASGPLSRTWVSHVENLRSSLSDDAWIMACGRVAKDELVPFLKAVANLDLVLAAQAAAEAGGAALPIAERILLAADEAASTEFAAWHAAMAMGLLRTEGCIARLRTHAQTDEPSRRKPYAERALSMAGDRDFLARVLPEADEFASFPGRATGGRIELWGLAPIEVTLELARRRLDTEPADGLFALSLRTIGAFGDSSDVERVTRVFLGSREPWSATRAFHCLYRLDANIAVHEMRSIIERSNPTGKVFAMRELAAVGAPVDLEWLLAFVVEQPRDEQDLGGKTDRQYHLLAQREAEKILGAYKFTPAMRAGVMQLFAYADESLREILWRLASQQDMQEIDDHVSAVFASGVEDEIGHAVYFLHTRTMPPDKKRALFEALIARIREDESLNFTWGSVRSLDMLAKNGFEDVVAQIAHRQMRALLEAYAATHADASPRLMQGSINVLDGVERDEAQFRVEFALKSLLPVLGAVADRLPLDGTIALLDINLSTTNDDIDNAMPRILARFPAEVIDERLATITDPFDRAGALRLAAELGFTERRLSLLRDGIDQFICHPAGLHTLFPAIKHLWCEQTARAMAEVVARHWDWDEQYGDQFFDEISSWIANQLPKDWAVAFVDPLLQETLHPWSRGILQLWSDVASHRRNA